MKIYAGSIVGCLVGKWIWICNCELELILTMIKKVFMPFLSLRIISSLFLVAHLSKNETLNSHFQLLKSHINTTASKCFLPAFCISEVRASALITSTLYHALSSDSFLFAVPFPGIYLFICTFVIWKSRTVLQCLMYFTFICFAVFVIF